MKKAIILGITGQDGSYLAELLLGKNYQVIGMVSPKNDIGQTNIEHIKHKLILESGDLLDIDSLKSIIVRYKPEEIYNLAGITFIPTSWKLPALTYDVNAMGVLRILQIIRDNSPYSRYFQASSAKMYGSAENECIDESESFKPEDPYAISKVAAHESVRLFRQHFGVFGSCGILFNHESPRRGEDFVTKKITAAAVKIKLGLQKKLALGNLDSQQDWGWAPDYVKGMWLMLQQEKSDDYILATGILHSVKEICQIAFGKLGLDYQEYIIRDEQFWRPIKGKQYFGNPKKAESILGWKREVEFEKMIGLMVDYDLKNISNTK